MSQPLPYGGFQWSTATLDDILQTPPSHDTGYIVEVDLDVPEDLHDKMNHYPLAPEHLEVQEEQLSPESRLLLERLNLEHKPFKKLVPNLNKKFNYVVHYRNLIQYVQQGLIVTKLHRVLQFDRKPWLKSYIDFNTAQRKKAKNTFEKNFFKLCNNAVFGKTIESIRKRTCIELINRQSRFNKVISKPNVRRFNKFDNGLVGVQINPVQITLDRPVYAGMTVLDLSKELMYKFYYDVQAFLALFPFDDKHFLFPKWI